MSSFGICERFQTGRRLGISCSITIFVLCLVGGTCGLVGNVVFAQTRNNHHGLKGERAAGIDPQRAAAKPQRNFGNPRAVQSKQAKIFLRNGKLTVVADNSDLVQILRRVALLGGMKVSGLKKTVRIFGVYGPGAPQNVLTKLLAGSGYNFMMTGKTVAGTPRKLLLLARTSAPPSASGNAPAAKPVAARPPENAPPPQRDFPLPTAPRRTRLGPGAIAHVPPWESQQNNVNSQSRARQNLQRLMQMHQQLDQQQQQGNPQN